jgi:hypothetical protein
VLVAVVVQALEVEIAQTITKAIKILKMAEPEQQHQF